MTCPPRQGSTPPAPSRTGEDLATALMGVVPDHGRLRRARRPALQGHPRDADQAALREASLWTVTVSRKLDKRASHGF